MFVGLTATLSFNCKKSFFYRQDTDKTTAPSLCTAPSSNPIFITWTSFLQQKLAGREGFEPSILDPKSRALPLGDRPSPNFTARSSPGRAKYRISHDPGLWELRP